jgi:hypothetical protein
MFCHSTLCLPAYKYSFDAQLISQCRNIMKWLDSTESRGSLECGTQRVMCGWSCGQEGARFSTWQVDTMCFCFSVCQHLYKVYIKMGNRCNRASMSGSDKRSQILTLLFLIKSNVVTDRLMSPLIMNNRHQCMCSCEKPQGNPYSNIERIRWPLYFTGKWHCIWLTEIMCFHWCVYYARLLDLRSKWKLNRITDLSEVPWQRSTRVSQSLVIIHFRISW